MIKTKPTKPEAAPAGRVRTPSYRSVHARRAILVAARQLLRSRGYARTTMEAVATKAGVGKITVYRRWPSKGALALEVLMEFQDFGAAPDTGTTRGDLIAIVRRLHSGLAHPTATAITPGLATDMAHDPTLVEAFHERFVAPRRQLLGEVIQRAVQRGDLPTAVDEDLLIDLLIGPYYYRMFITGHPVEPDLAAHLADFVLLGQIPQRA
ncbi:MAG TPA: TetR/AcrR family transcriptional regulator [Acidimicrobiales bacterium]|nr:TetR/AcrR family transcriptional regulator [Acidimicrobiales bacterium]